MQIRETDNSQVVDESEIRKSRSKAPWWFAGLMAALTAFAATLSGTSYVQVEELRENPQARPDAWTKSMAEAAHADILNQHKALSQITLARWTELQEDMRAIQSANAGTLAVIQELVSNCASVRAVDQALQRQVDTLDKRVDQLTGVIYSHVGLSTNGHTKKPQTE